MYNCEKGYEANDQRDGGEAGEAIRDPFALLSAAFADVRTRATLSSFGLQLCRRRLKSCQPSKLPFILQSHVHMSLPKNFSPPQQS